MITYFEFLEELKKSGNINMFASVPLLVDEFNISKEDARKIIIEWMKQYKY
jgi:hypothetical protein